MHDQFTLQSLYEPGQTGALADAGAIRISPPPASDADPIRSSAATACAARLRPVASNRNEQANADSAARRPRRDLVGAAIAAFEEWARRTNTPYVCVKEAQRAIRQDGPSTLRLFHFVVYGATGPNLLVTFARPDADLRRDLAKWGELFGAGFLPVFGNMADGEPRFVGLDRQPIALA